MIQDNLIRLFNRMSWCSGDWFGFHGVVNVLEWYNRSSERDRSYAPYHSHCIRKSRVPDSINSEPLSFTRLNSMLMYPFVRTSNVSPRLKSFFINFMMNSGGMAVQCLFTVSHSEITVLSNFTQDIQLIEAIDKFKVNFFKFSSIKSIDINPSWTFRSL